MNVIFLDLTKKLEAVCVVAMESGKMNGGRKKNIFVFYSGGSILDVKILTIDAKILAKKHNHIF